MGWGGDGVSVVRVHPPPYNLFWRKDPGFGHKAISGPVPCLVLKVFLRFSRQVISIAYNFKDISRGLSTSTCTRYAPMSARCCCAAQSILEGLRGVTTVCLVFRSWGPRSALGSAPSVVLGEQFPQDLLQNKHLST